MADGNPGCDASGTVGPVDDFEDGVAAPNWSAVLGSGTTAVEAGGVVTLSPNPNSTGGNYAEYNAVQDVSLTGARVFVEVVATTNPATIAATRFRHGGGNQYLQMEETNGMLSVQSRTSGQQPVTLATVTYSPSAHRWWQLREAGGTVYGEVSTDATNWQIIGSGPTPAWPSNPRSDMLAGTNDPVANPGAAQFDNFNRCP